MENSQKLPSSQNEVDSHSENEKDNSLKRKNSEVSFIQSYYI